MKKILILCTGNSCRSQMAEGWLRHFAGDNAEVFSAGLETHGVNPSAIRVMAESNIDISGHSSDNLEQYLEVSFDYIITVCDNANERCPIFPGKAMRIHHSFPDPAKATGNSEEILDEFRKVRDMIRDYSKLFVEKHF